MDHVALGMPVLVDRVSVDLDKLFQDSCSAPGTLDGESRRIVEVTIDGSGVFVVRVLRSEHGRTDGTREVFDVKFHVCRAQTESLSAPAIIRAALR